MPPASPAVTAWRVIASGPGPGAWNLALDDAIFASVRAGGAPPTLRLYGWSPPALTIGYGQDRDRDVDLAACAAAGVEVLRRSTGGRAVLHDREVTYSVAAPAGLPPFGRTLDEACEAVSSALVVALHLLGVAGARAADGLRASGAPRSADCFAVASPHEVEAGGRKLVGSAQRREGGAFLQHGSIALDGPSRALQSLLRGGGRPAAAAPGGPRGSHAPGEILAALVRGGEQGWGARFALGAPTPEERGEAERIRRERYRSPAWNAGRLPGRGGCAGGPLSR